MQIQFTVSFPKISAPRVQQLFLLLLLPRINGRSFRVGSSGGGSSGKSDGGGSSYVTCFRLLLVLPSLGCHCVCNVYPLDFLHLGYIQGTPVKVEGLNYLRYLKLYEILHFKNYILYIMKIYKLCVIDFLFLYVRNQYFIKFCCL